MVPRDHLGRLRAPAAGQQVSNPPVISQVPRSQTGFGSYTQSGMQLRLKIGKRHAMKLIPSERPELAWFCGKLLAFQPFSPPVTNMIPVP